MKRCYFELRPCTGRITFAIENYHLHAQYIASNSFIFTESAQTFDVVLVSMFSRFIVKYSIMVSQVLNNLEHSNLVKSSTLVILHPALYLFEFVTVSYLQS